jgi:hypothetical protein
MTERTDQTIRMRRGGRLKSGLAGTTNEPDWTHGLKRLYDQVLEEPVPDTFKDLLSKLDTPKR